MADKTFDVVPEVLRTAATSIATEQGNYQRSLGPFKDGVRQLTTENGWVDAYNDAIQDAMRAGEDAIAAFGSLVANLEVRVTNLRITADNYQLAQEAAIRRYNGEVG